MGPSDKSLKPKLAALFILLAISMDGFALGFLWPEFAWLIVTTLVFGVLTLILMWTV